MKHIRSRQRRLYFNRYGRRKRKPVRKRRTSKEQELTAAQFLDEAQEQRIVSMARKNTGQARRSSGQAKGQALYRIAVAAAFLYFAVSMGTVLIPAIQLAAGGNGDGIVKVIERTGRLLSPLYASAMDQNMDETVKKAIEENENSKGADGGGLQPDSLGESEAAGGGALDINLSGSVEVVFGEGYNEQGVIKEKDLLKSNQYKINMLENTLEYTYLLKNFYIVDSTTTAVEENFPVKELLTKDLSIVKNAEEPQILIHHTHASETFSDSRPGVQEDTVVGMGIELARLLSEEYGFQVIHDKTAYDMAGGKLDRSKAYNYAEEGTRAILEEYPSIQVIIDLHRDGGAKRVTEINGKKTAQIMFFNGLSRNTNGPITYLYNPYIKDNLAFSLQLKIAAMEKYADLTKNIYLKGYEYNLSLMPRSLLIEVGTAANTVSEDINAMEPLAEILAEVLNGRE